MPIDDTTMTERRISGDEELLKSLIELERNTAVEIKRQRDSVRVTQAWPVAIRAANPSERFKWQIDGYSADLSEGGARLLLPLPILVGDYYQLGFTGHEDALEPVVGQCLRCRMLREDAFEVGFRFLEKLPLSTVMGEDGAPDSDGFDSLI